MHPLPGNTPSPIGSLPERDGFAGELEMEPIMTHENSHPVTLFTGQWADLPFEEVARLAAEWGYDGLEIAC